MLYSFSAETQSRHLKLCAKSAPIVTTVSGYAISSRSSTGLRHKRSASLFSLRAQFKQFLSLALSATVVSFSHAFRVRESLPSSIALASARAAARPHIIHGTRHDAMRQSNILHLSLLQGKGAQSRPHNLFCVNTGTNSGDLSQPPALQLFPESRSQFYPIRKASSPNSSSSCSNPMSAILISPLSPSVT